MAEGSFRGTLGDAEIRRNILRSHNYPDIRIVLRTRCNFTTNIARDDDLNLWVENGQKGVWMPRSDIDGIVTTGEAGTALAIANADCPVIRLWNNKEGWLGIAHGALRCLVPPDGTSPGILAEFCRLHPPTPSTHADICCGVGECCYGLEHPPECTENALVAGWPRQAPDSTATTGKRAGWPTVNLRKLARRQLERLGFTLENIHDDSETLPCTACATDMSGNHLYHSNVRDGKDAGRNLAIAWRSMNIEEKKKR